MPPTNRLLMVKDLQTVVERSIDHARIVQNELHILSAEAADMSEVLGDLDQAVAKLKRMAHRLDIGLG